MTRTILSLFLALFFTSVAQSAPRGGELPYYGEDFFRARASDGALKESLFVILSQNHNPAANDYDKISASCDTQNCYKHTEYGYNRAREFIMGEFYLVKKGSEYGLKDVYCQRVVESYEFHGRKPGPTIIPDPNVMNTEHTWPQSKFVRGTRIETQKSDMHHLFPTDSKVNSDRSSYDFGNVQTDAKRLNCQGPRFGASHDGAKVFEAPPAHKGNVARAIFYFSVRYHAPIDRAQEETLREWNRLDPVDAEEKTRNDAIFAKQFNRNPFVDYPELADRISDF